MDDGEYVRLYKEGGTILALVSGTERVRLLSFASNGQLLEDQELLGHPSLSVPPQTAALTLLPEGRRLLGVATNMSEVVCCRSCWPMMQAVRRCCAKSRWRLTSNPSVLLQQRSKVRCFSIPSSAHRPWITCDSLPMIAFSSMTSSIRQVLENRSCLKVEPKLKMERYA
jgi:hypothetical protein